jgi:hypothetical protein
VVGGDIRGVHLTGHILVVMQDFEDQGISNTLHNTVKHWYKIDRSSFVDTERRVEAISGEFNSQDIANTLGMQDFVLESILQQHKDSVQRQLILF